MTPPIITLTTDFGLEDHYVGTMKGVILSRCPTALLVDITHEIEPFSVLNAAYAIWQAAPYFPAGTLHLIVVDPGVGTERKPLLASAHDQFFIAPDNGLLTFVLSKDVPAELWELSNQDLWLPAASQTFHGRDIFAAVAGKLASGDISPHNVGKPLSAALRLENLEPIELSGGGWRGLVLSVDHFGNLITNFRSSEFAPKLCDNFSLRLGTETITKMRATFSSAPAGEVFVYQGSSGYLEIGMRQDNAARRCAAKSGDPVILDLGC